ncbi:P-loop containing nucleoside triphosphate hydrolase protein [Pavlovales sp. CCMP2436]|nr:P-loop containing nucleoside triphosphate hydrolase protein [Pavlovales sp. CCMP2436]
MCSTRRAAVLALVLALQHNSAEPVRSSEDAPSSTPTPRDLRSALLGQSDAARSLYRGCALTAPGALSSAMLADAYTEPRPASTAKRIVVIFGAQKGGTTSLLYALKAVRHWCGTFEPHFFDETQWAARHVNSSGLRRYLALWARCPSTTVIPYEKTPDYLVSPHAALRVCQTLPAARLVAVLREPVARAYSGFHETFFSGGTLLADAHVPRSADGFQLITHIDSQIVARCGGLPRPEESSWDVRGAVVRTFRACCGETVARLRSEGLLPGAERLPLIWPGCECASKEAACTALGDTRAAPIRRGVYSRQLRTWYARFRPEQVLLLLFDELTSEPAKQLARIQQFATGMQPQGRDASVRMPRMGSKSRKGKGFGNKDLYARTVEHLGRFYAPFNLELEELLGRKLPAVWSVT